MIKCGSAIVAVGKDIDTVIFDEYVRPGLNSLYIPNVSLVVVPRRGEFSPEYTSVVISVHSDHDFIECLDVILDSALKSAAKTVQSQWASLPPRYTPEIREPRVHVDNFLGCSSSAPALYILLGTYTDRTKADELYEVVLKSFARLGNAELGRK